MSKFWKGDDLRFLLAVGSGGFVFILISKGLGSFSVDGFWGGALWLFTLLFKEAGVALMIAAALGYSVEAIVRAKHKKEQEEFKQQVSENVLSAVFKKIVPDSVFEEIRRGVLEQTLISRDSTLRYDLKELTHEECNELELAPEEHGYYLACEITTSNELVNLSDLKIPKHEIKAGVSCDLHSKLSSGLQIHHVTIEDLNTRKKEVFSGDELEEYLDRSKPGFLIFKKSQDLEAKGRYQITVCSKTFKRIADTDVWTTLLPTENMSVSISYPKKLRVFAKSNHSKQIREETSNPEMNERKYTLRHGIFPHQGIAFWWRVV